MRSPGCAKGVSTVSGGGLFWPQKGWWEADGEEKPHPEPPLENIWAGRKSAQLDQSSHPAPAP